MSTHGPVSPRRVAVGILIGLAVTLPVIYHQVPSGGGEVALLNADDAAQAPGLKLSEPPPGVERVIPPNAIPAIYNPQFVPAEQARAAADAPMIAFTRGGVTHAYSLRLLNGHEIVNDTVAGEPVAVTW